MNSGSETQVITATVDSTDLESPLAPPPPPRSVNKLCISSRLCFLTIFTASCVCSSCFCYLSSLTCVSSRVLFLPFPLRVFCLRVDALAAPRSLCFRPLSQGCSSFFLPMTISRRNVYFPLHTCRPCVLSAAAPRCPNEGPFAQSPEICTTLLVVVVAWLCVMQ